MRCFIYTAKFEDRDAEVLLLNPLNAGFCLKKKKSINMKLYNLSFASSK